MAELSVPGAYQFDIDYVNGPLRVFVYKPQCVTPSTGFPVVYSLDGNAHFLSFISSVKAHSIRPHLTGLDPAVIVGIGYPVNEDHDLVRRTLDYTPHVDTSFLGETPDGHPWPETGGADVFLSFLENEIKPRIESDIKIDAERQTLFGHSFGGLCTLYAALTKPGNFRNFVISSPSIWFGEKRIFAFIDGFDDRLSEVAKECSLILSVGSLEQSVSAKLEEIWPAYAQWIRCNNMVGNLREIYTVLRDLNLPHLDVSLTEIENEHHGSVPPMAIHKALPSVLRTPIEKGISS